ncbi:class I SAM-dependent methyltransferase [Chloroflexota bacterium]
MGTNNGRSAWGFRGMALWLRLRERFRDPEVELVEIGLGAGQTILDYGCGIGSYTIPAARIVGRTGATYALDIHPLAAGTVERRARSAGLTNLETICSDCDTGLESGSVDVPLLYDVLHTVKDKARFLRELGRVLKPGGLLAVKPDHMTADQLQATMNSGNLFVLRAQRGKLFEFVRQANT